MYPKKLSLLQKPQIKPLEQQLILFEQPIVIGGGGSEVVVEL